MTPQQNVKMSTIIKISLFVFLIQCSIVSMGQNFLMSSIGPIPGTSSNMTALNFKSNSNCMDVQSGLAVLNNTTRLGNFDVNCILSTQFNTLGLKLFPNPVQSNARLRLSSNPSTYQNFKISIWNTDGHMISQSYESSAQLYQGLLMNLNNLVAGSYLLKAESSVYIEAIKFIKVK